MITVIIATYNREHLIERAIKSVLNQTLDNWELIIIDDGSTDNTDQLMKTYTTDGRIKYVKKEHSTPAHTRNVGASYATQDFITFLDDDDEAYPSWLEVVQSSIKEDTGIVCCAAIRKFHDGTLYKDNLFEVNFYGEKKKVKFTCGSLFIRRTVFAEINGYDLNMRNGLQTDLGYSILHQLKNTNLKIVSIDQHLVQINLHKGARLSTNWELIYPSAVYFVNKHYQFLKNWNRTELANNYCVIAYYCFRLNDRKESISYLLKAIRFRPLKVINYFRIVKYAI